VVNNTVSAEINPTTAQVVCGTTATLPGVNPSVGKGLWTRLGGGATIVNPSLNNSQVTGLTSGSNVFRWMVSEGACSEFVVAEIFNNSFTVDAGADQIVCEATANLAGSVPGTGGNGTWTSIGLTSKVTSPSLYNSSVTELDGGTNTLRWTVVKGGCSASDDVIITNNSFSVDAGSDVAICADNYTFTTFDPTPGTGLWTRITGNADFDNETLHNTTVRNLATGANTMRWTVTKNTCTAFSDIVVTNNVPSNAQVVAGEEVCENTATLTASLPEIYDAMQWTVISSEGVIVSASNNITPVKDLNRGINKFRWTISKGVCTSYADVTIINNMVSLNSPDVTLCSTGGFMKAADPDAIGATGLWISVSGASITNNTLFNTYISNLNPGANTFQWIVSKGICSKMDEVIVRNDLPYVNAGTNQVVCNEDYTLIGNDPTEDGKDGTGVWKSIGSTATIDDNTYFNTTVVLGPGNNTFRWIVTDNGCKDSADVVITNKSFTVNAGLDKAVCSTSANLEAIELFAGQTGEWTISSGEATIVIPTIAKTTINSLASGTTIFKWTVYEQNCTAYDEVAVTNNIPSPAITGPDVAVCKDEATFVVAVAPTIGNGKWTLKEGAGIIEEPTNLNSKVTAIGRGANTFTWTVTKGECTSFADYHVSNNTVDATIIGIDKRICETFTTLRAESLERGEGIWKRNEGSAVVVDPTNTVTQVTNLSQGQNTFRWVVSYLECTAEDVINIYNDIPSPSYANEGAIDTEVCKDVINLSANTPDVGNGKWSVIEGVGVISDLTLASSDVTLSSGINTFRWTVTKNECSNVSDVTIMNNRVEAEAGDNQNICKDEAILNAFEPTLGYGLWSKVTSAGTIDNISNFRTTVKNIGDGVNRFRWTVYEGICTAYDVVEINNNAVQTSAGSDQSICENVTTLSGKAPINGGVGTWTSIGGGTPAIANPTLYNTQVTNLVENNGATYQFRWTVNENGCSVFDDVVITNNSFKANAGFDLAVCSTEANLPAFQLLSGTGVWSVVIGSGQIQNPTLYNSLVTNMGKGENTFRWIVTKNDCSAADEVIVSNDLPTDANVANPIIACSNEADLVADEPNVGSGIWTFRSGSGVIINATNYLAHVTGLSQGLNEFNWTVTNNACMSQAVYQVTNNTVDAKILEDNKNVCTTTTQLVAEEPNFGTGLWTVAGGAGDIANETASSTTVSNMNNGSNRFRWTVTQGTCSDVDEIEIVDNSVESDAGIDQIVCLDNATLNAKQPVLGTGYWTQLSGTGSITDKTNNKTEVTGLTRYPITNEFEWTVELNGCSAKDVVTVTSNYVTADAGQDQVICGTSTYLEAVNPPVGAGFWTVIGGSAEIVNDNTTATNAQVINLAQGSNKFRWTVIKGECSADDVVEIINNAPYVDAGQNQEVCDNFTKLGGSTPTLGTGVWTQIGGNTSTIENPTLFNSFVRGLTSGTYTYQWTVTEGICSNADVVIINNKSFEVNAGVNQTVCINSTQLNAEDPASGTGIWTNLGSTGTIVDETSFKSKVTDLAPGANTYRWTIYKNECSNYADVIITNDAPTTASAGADQDICENQVILYGNKPSTGLGKGEWSRISGEGSILTPTSESTIITDMKAGANTFRWTITKNNCTSFDEVTVNNYTVSANAGRDQRICADTTKLEALTTGLAGEWTVIAGAAHIDENTLFNSVIRNVGSGKNTLRWTVSANNCSSSDEVDIYKDIPSIANTDLDQEVCENEATLNANKPENYETGKWTLESGGGIFTDETSFITDVTKLGTGINTFKWTISYNKCTSFDYMIIVNNTVSANAGLNQTICANETLLSASNPSVGQGNWVRVGGNGNITEPTSYNTYVTDLSVGINKFRWIVVNGNCTASDDMDITNNTVVADAGLDQAVCENSAILHGNDRDGDRIISGTWSVISGSGSFSDGTLYETVVSQLSEGANTLRWTVTESGCSDYDDVAVVNNSFKVDAGSDFELCGSEAQLNSLEIEGGVGEWMRVGDAGDIITPSAYNTVVTNMVLGGNQFRWTVSRNNCSSSDVIIVTNNMPTQARANRDFTVCDATANLVANNPDIGTGKWLIEGGTGVIANPSSYITTVTDLGVGKNVFIWRIENKGCFTYDTLNVTNNKVLANAGFDTDICAYEINLAAVEAPVDAIGKWTVMVGDIATTVVTESANNSHVTGLTFGKNTFKWTVYREGCSASDEVNINNISPTPADAGDDFKVCTDDATLVAVYPNIGTGLWSLVSGKGTIETPNQYVSKVNGLQIGANTFRWTTTSTSNTTCVSTDEVIVTNNKVTPNAGEDRDVCSTTINLNAENPTPGEGFWTSVGDVATIVTPTKFNSQVMNLGPSTNTFKWTVDRNGCTGVDYVVITNNAVHAEAGDEQFLCTDFTLLNGSKPNSDRGETGQWIPVVGTMTIANPTLYSSEVKDLGPGANRLRWIVTGTHCKDSADVIINNNTVFAYAGIDLDLCEPTTVLSAVKPETGTGTWTVIGGEGSFDNANKYNAVVSDLAPGPNVLEWTVVEGVCSSADQVTIINNEVYADAGDPQKVCNNEAKLAGSVPTGTETGVWTLLSGSGVIANPSVYNSMITNMISGTQNILKWTVADGVCSSADVVYITNYTVVSDAGEDKELCVDSIRMSAAPLAGKMTGLWTVKWGSGIIEDPTRFNTTVYNIGRGQNTFVWTVVEDACIEEDEVIITNNQITVDAGTAQILCTNTTSLEGSKPDEYGTGVWAVETGAATFVNMTQNNTVVTDLGAGMNTMRWTVSRKGCVYSDVVEITNFQIKVNAGQDQTLCRNFTGMAGNDPIVNSPTAQGRWSVASGSAKIVVSTQFNTEITDIQTGANTLRWTIYDHGCSASDMVVITNNFPSSPTVGPDQIVCNNQADLIASMPGVGTGRWSIVSGSGVIAIPSQVDSKVTNLGPGNNILRWTVTEGICQVYKEVLITNNSTSSNAGGDQAICKDFSQFSASKPKNATGSWSIVSGFGMIADVSSIGSPVTSLASGVNTFRWTTSENGCTATDDVVIVNNLPSEAIVGDGSMVCEPKAELTAVAPLVGKGSWVVVAGFGVIQVPTNSNTIVNELGQGINKLRWIVDQNGCTSYADMIFVNNTVYANAGLDKAVCATDAQLTAVETGTATGVWSVESGFGNIADVSTNNTGVTNLNSGSNTFRWTVSENGCTSFDDIFIINNLPTNAEVRNDTTICENQIELVANNPLVGKGKWIVAGGSGTFDNQTMYNTMVRKLGQGINKFRWSITQGECTSYAEVRITNYAVDAIAGINKDVCGSEYTMRANPPVDGGSGIWTLETGQAIIADASFFNTKVTGLQTGANTFRWAVESNGCSDYQDVVITNNKFIAEAGQNQNLCVNFADLSANLPIIGIGKWTIPAGYGVIADAFSNITEVIELGAGSNVFRWTVTEKGCASFDEVLLVNYSVEANAGDNVIVCAGAETELIANNPGAASGVWTVKSGQATVTNPSSYITDVTNLGQGANTLTWAVTKTTGTLTCTNYDDVVVANNEFEVYLKSESVICGTEYELVANDPGTGADGFWSVEGGSAEIANPTHFRTMATGLRTGLNVFRWSVSKNGCKDSKTIAITNDLYEARAGAKQEICENETQLAADLGEDAIQQRTLGLLEGKWSIISGSGEFDVPYGYNGTEAAVNLTNPVISNLKPGRNILRWTVTKTNTIGNCVDYDDVEIVNNTVTLGAGENQVVCGSTANLKADELPIGATGTWSSPYISSITFEDKTHASTKVSGLINGNNTIKWTVYYLGCKGESYVMVSDNSFYTWAGEDQEVLEAEAVTTLNAQPLPSSADWGHWTVIAGSGNFNCGDAYLPNTDVCSLGLGMNVFRWTVKKDGCTAYDDVTINYIGEDMRAIVLEKELNICEDSVKVNARSPLTGSGRWVVVSGSNITFEDDSVPSTWVYGLRPGKSIIEWTVRKNNYLSKDSLVIYNNSFKVDALVQFTTTEKGYNFYNNKVEVCDDYVILKGQKADDGKAIESKGYWGGSGTAVDRFIDSTAVTGFVPGRNVMNWYVERKNCLTCRTCYAQDSVEVMYYAPPEANFVTDKKEGCSPMIVKFSNQSENPSGSNTDMVYVWKVSDGQRSSEAEPSFTFKNLGEEDKYIKYTVSLTAKANNGTITCETEFNDSILVYPTPPVDFDFSPKDIVYSDPGIEVSLDNLSGRDDIDYTWDFGNGVSKSEVTNYTYESWGLEPDWRYPISLTSRTAHCDSTMTKYITIYPPAPQCDSSYAEKGCETLQKTFDGNWIKYTIPNGFYWLLSNGAKVEPDDNKYGYYEFPEAQDYIAELWAYNIRSGVMERCREDKITVWKRPTAEFDYTPKEVMVAGPDMPKPTPVHFYNKSEGATSYIWYFGDDSTSVDISPTHVYRKEGLINVKLLAISENNCLDSSSVYEAVVVHPTGRIVFPNAFTPNNDSQNDVFIPLFRGVDPEAYKLQVFNRWGALIFESTDVTLGWDGKDINGNLVPQDVYVWKATGRFKVVESTSGQAFEKVGDVTLIR